MYQTHPNYHTIVTGIPIRFPDKISIVMLKPIPNALHNTLQEQVSVRGDHSLYIEASTGVCAIFQTTCNTLQTWKEELLHCPLQRQGPKHHSYPRSRLASIQKQWDSHDPRTRDSTCLNERRTSSKHWDPSRSAQGWWIKNKSAVEQLHPRTQWIATCKTYLWKIPAAIRSSKASQNKRTAPQLWPWQLGYTHHLSIAHQSKNATRQQFLCKNESCYSQGFELK